MAIRRDDLPTTVKSLLIVAVFGLLANSPVMSVVPDIIGDSIIGSAKAESEFYSLSPTGTACWTTTIANVSDPCPTPSDESVDVCIVENTTETLDLFYYGSNTSGSQINTELNSTTNSQTPATGLVVLPTLLSTIDPYNSDFVRYTYRMSMTAPEVPLISSPILTTVNFDGDFEITDYSASRTLAHIVEANVRMENQNTGPILSNLGPDEFSENLANPDDTINLDVFVDYFDEEGNSANLIFELSDDGFDTIIQTQNVGGVASGDTATATFEGLGVGSYDWRVSATETDAAGNCIGFANADPPINLTADAGPTTFVLATSDELADTGVDPTISWLIGMTLITMPIYLAHRRRKIFQIGR